MISTSSITANYYIKVNYNNMEINKKHNEILRIYEQKLKYFHHAKRTIEIYFHYVK